MTTKKTTKSTVRKTVKPAVAEIALPDPYCHCTKHKRNIILTCVSLVCLLLGFLISQLFFCDTCTHKRAPRLRFVNDCLDTTTINQSRIKKELPLIDANKDGCITREEWVNARRAARVAKRPNQNQEPSVNVENAIAPVME